MNLNLTCKKIIHKSKSTLGQFPFFHFYHLSQKTSENEMEISQMSSFICKNATFLSTKCLRHFHEKKSFQFVSSLFGVRSWSRNSSEL